MHTRVTAVAILAGMLLLSGALDAGQAHMVFVYWDADQVAARPPRSSLVNPAVLQRCVIEDVDQEFYERTGSGHHFDGILIGFAVRFDRPESKRTIFRASFTDYDAGVEYVSSFPDHHIFAKPDFAN